MTWLESNAVEETTDDTEEFNAIKENLLKWFNELKEIEKSIYLI